MSKKPLLISGLTFGIAVVALTAGAFIVPQGSTASAQGLAKNSAKAVAQLSPAAKQELMTSTKTNVDDQLKAAQSAKDLETLTYDQVMSRYAHALPPTDGKGPDLHSLKFLKYTDDQGATVVLGLDSHNLPVFCTVMMGDPSGVPGNGPASMHFEGSASAGADSGAPGAAGAGGPGFTTGGAQVGGDGPTTVGPESGTAVHN